MAHALATRRCLAALAACGLAAAAAHALLTHAAAQTPDKSASQRTAARVAEKTDGGSKGGGQGIVVLVNDEPITAYEIEQRAALMALSAGGGGQDLKAKAEARWAQIIKDPKTTQRFQELLREKNVRSREEAQALQKQYVMNLQQNMIEQLKREARSGQLPRLRKEAQEELIEERLKLQEAKRLGVEVGEEDLGRIVTAFAERNQMTAEKFLAHLRASGVDPNTMRDRLRAHAAWTEVMRRRYSAQIAVTQRDIDRIVSAAAGESGEEAVELQIQRITLPIPESAGQAAIARRFSEAEGLRRKFGGCKGMADLAKSVADAKFDDLKYTKPGNIPEPTRSLLLAAKDGDILPPYAAGSGIEVYALCGRRATKADDAQRTKAQAVLQQRELEVLAKRHLHDLRQDAHIQYR